LKKLLRYPHTGAQVQQHVARGMEQMRIYLLQYAAGKIAVKWAGCLGCLVVPDIISMTSHKGMARLNRLRKNAPARQSVATAAKSHRWFGTGFAALKGRSSTVLRACAVFWQSVKPLSGPESVSRRLCGKTAFGKGT